MSILGLLHVLAAKGGDTERRKEAYSVIFTVREY
jgi:hypothetical protein